MSTVFDIGIQPERRLTDTGSTDHHAVDIACVHQSDGLFLANCFTADHDALCLRSAFFVGSPLLWLIVDLGIGLINLASGSPPRSTVLTVSDGLALDSVQPIQVRSQGDEYKKTAHDGGYKNEYLNTSYGASLLSLHGHGKRFSLLSGLFSFHSTAQAKAIESKSEQLAVLNNLFHGGNRTCFFQFLFQGKQLFSDVISEQSRRLGIPVRTVNGLHLPDIL